MNSFPILLVLISALIDKGLELTVGDFISVYPIIGEGKLGHSFITRDEQSFKIICRGYTNHARRDFGILVKRNIALQGSIGSRLEPTEEGGCSSEHGSESPLFKFPNEVASRLPDISKGRLPDEFPRRGGVTVFSAKHRDADWRSLEGNLGRNCRP
jgi:hypothetical protein